MRLPSLDMDGAVRMIATIAITSALTAVVVVGWYERSMVRACYDRGYCVSPSRVLMVREQLGSNLETVRRLDPRLNGGMPEPQEPEDAPDPESTYARR